MIIKEAYLRRDEFPTPPTTVYLGGGTPSILAGQRLSRLVDGMNKCFDMSQVVEFTIEANPDDINPAFLTQLSDLNINRVSIGLQTFDDATLKLLNRQHNAHQAIDALTMLSDASINYSADLIFGLPNQTLEAWRESFSRLLSFRPPHFSAYLLSYEPGTRLNAMLSRGLVEEASAELAQQMYQVITTAAAEAGYEHYEISNYAKPGLYSRHNSSYWTGESYLGLGAASHSFTLGLRRFNPPSIKAYIQAIAEGKCCYEVDEETIDQQFNDLIITSLRTSAGLPISLVTERFGSNVCNQLLSDAAPLTASNHLKLISQPSERLIIPESKWLTSDYVMRKLIRV
jgi:oxygen-independent coproporphyrinogen-3 oxidase